MTALIWLIAWASVVPTARLTVVVVPPMVKASTSAAAATVTYGAWPLAVVRDVLVAVPAAVAIALPALCRAGCHVKCVWSRR